GYIWKHALSYFLFFIICLQEDTMSNLQSVGLPAMSVGTWLLALLPVVVVLTLMMAFKMSGARAGVISWLVAVAVVYFTFGGGAEVLASGTVKGLWTTIFVLFIIWNYMLLYNLVDF